MDCRALPSAWLLPLLEEAAQFDVVGIDEGQFFADIVEFVSALVDRHGRTVVVATLLRDCRRSLWPNRVHELLADADERPVLPAACAGCGSERALFTRKKPGKGSDDFVVEIGGMDLYESLCRQCWREGGV
jgi:thymidine kinase